MSDPGQAAVVSHRTAAATQARRSGGCEDGLLHLCSLYRAGATILAGTGVPVAVPVWPHPRVALDCPQKSCGSTVFGDDDGEALNRLAQHHRRCHP